MSFFKRRRVEIAEILKGRRVYLDACVFIYALEGVSEWRGLVQAIFQAIDGGHCAAMTSELTLVECLIMPLRLGNPTLAEQYKNALQTRPGLAVLPVNRPVWMEMAALRAASPSLRTPDAIHLASAALNRCDLFLTNDKRLKQHSMEIIQFSELGSPKTG